LLPDQKLPVVGRVGCRSRNPRARLVALHNHRSRPRGAI
jgi:hypothetical protein